MVIEDSSGLKIISDDLILRPDIIKQSYTINPVSLIQYPEDVEVPSKEMRKNVKDGILYSLGYGGSGVRFDDGKDISVGSNYYMNTKTLCDETSSEECRGKDRYVYIRNIPTGTIPPFNLSFYNATGCNLTGLTEGRGIVPGLIEDVYDFNPIELGRAVSGIGNLGSSTCKKMTLPVGSKIYSKDKENNTWNWETKCTSGYNTMTETTNRDLNTQVVSKNPDIIRARLPGPLQLRENFEISNKKYNTKLLILIIGAITALAIFRARH